MTIVQAVASRYQWTFCIVYNQGIRHKILEGGQKGFTCISIVNHHATILYQTTYIVTAIKDAGRGRNEVYPQEPTRGTDQPRTYYEIVEHLHNKGERPFYAYDENLVEAEAERRQGHRDQKEMQEQDNQILQVIKQGTWHHTRTLGEELGLCQSDVEDALQLSLIHI